MFFHRRTIPGLAIYSYMVGDEVTKRCAVIDPVRDVDPYIEIAEKNGMHISDILETHVHADFLSGSKELKSRLKGAPQIHCSGMGGADWTPKYADRVVENGDSVDLGKVRLTAIHTPGHTMEHVMWALYDETRSAETPWLFFTGDYLFVGSIGRPDLLGAEAQKTLAHLLYNTTFKVFPELPDFAEAFPAHGAGSLCGKAIGSRPSTTIGYERRFNSSLVEAPEQEWIGSLMHDMPPAPPYFARMKKINVEGAPLLGKELPGHCSLSCEEVQALIEKGAQVIDSRSKEAFATSHIPGAINIPISPQLSTWAGWFISPDQPIIIVTEEPSEVIEVITQLIRIGFDNIEGHLEGGIVAWTNGGYPLKHLGTVSVHELDKQLGKYTLLDVRTDAEWEGGHIDGAQHVQPNELAPFMEKMSKDIPLAVVCGAGYRASTICSILKREGFENVSNVLGGMAAWKRANLGIAHSV